ncbi:MAG: hypothetical protein K1X78_09420 [Verrucomicrobiaceae bacterium]|nr:hypothetical protein [Verrucomicrobiaceae bacterium]
MPRPSKYSPAEKSFLLKTARALLREGVSRKEICTRLQLQNAMLTSWLKQEALDAMYPPMPSVSLRNRAAHFAVSSHQRRFSLGASPP